MLFGFADGDFRQRRPDRVTIRCNHSQCAVACLIQR
jgi:hypothetical protein